MRMIFLCVVACSIFLLQACSITGTGADSADAPSSPGESSSRGGAGQGAGDFIKLQEDGVVIFPHLPVPVELEKVESETVVFTTPEFHGGIFTLKGSISLESAADFFQRRLPKEGWMLAGRLESETCYMAFKNSTGGSVLMQIRRVDMGFKTEVRIFVSEGGGSAEFNR